MASVQDIIDSLEKIPKDKRHLKVICIDTRSGDSNEIDVSEDVTTVSGDEEAGVLCDMTEGEEYVRAYCG